MSRWLAAGVAAALATLGLMVIVTTPANAAGGAHGTSTTTDVTYTGPCAAPPRTVLQDDPTNCNAYSDKADVWLSGLGSAGIPDGTYYFEVISPGDQNNLVAGNLSGGAQDPERTFTITNGVVSYGGLHGFDTIENKIQIGPDFGTTTNPGGVYILAVCPTDGGNCKYDAFKVGPGDGTGGSAEVPVVTKDADGSFDLTYGWDITKSVDKTRVEQVGGTATFNYTLSVHHDAGTPSQPTVTGTITVFNPNLDVITGVDVTDSIVDAASTTSPCSVTDGAGVTLDAGTNTFHYECNLAAMPVGDLSNTATATWGDQDLADGPLAAGQADFLLTPITLTANPVDACVDVTDVFNGGTPDSEGTICVQDPDVNPQTIMYHRDIPVPAFGCKSYDNTATATAADSSTASNSNKVTVTVCGPVQTGALTIGYWQNKNGQGIITGQAKTGVCGSGTWLRQFAPFQDLSATATCAQVATYVTNVIKAANASGAAMNAMLKAQMLATALDVYFSDPALGGNKIGAPAPIGGVAIDLTKVCKNIPSCTTFENTSAVFGANSATVSQLLTTAASHSNVGGTTWYGQVKATQELAKDTFDAINNQVAFGA